MDRASEPQRLAKPARSRGQHPRHSTLRQPPIQGHPLNPGQRLQRPQQYAPGPAFNLAGNIHAKVAAVNRINVRKPCGTKKNRAPRRRTAMGMRSRIGRPVVRAKISLGLHNPSGQQPSSRIARQHLAQQPRRHMLRRRFEEAARQQPAKRVPHVSISRPGSHGYLCPFFHSFSSASTSSAWPSGVTLGKMCSRVWSGPITNVVRSMPQTFLPYMFFSFNTPN